MGGARDCLFGELLRARSLLSARAVDLAPLLCEVAEVVGVPVLGVISDGQTSIDRVCERAGKTPLHGEVSDAYDPAKERIQVRDYAVEIASRSSKRCL